MAISLQTIVAVVNVDVLSLCIWTAATNGPIVHPPGDRLYEYRKLRWNDIGMGNWRTGEKTCTSATLSTTNPKWTNMGANPGLRGRMLATNRLSHGTANHNVTIYLI
jgi:hypothetical protein